MYKSTFHSSLWQARQDCRESLKRLEQRCGIAASRLTRLERGQASPSSSERKALAAAFPEHRRDMLFGGTCPAGMYRTLKARGMRYSRTGRPYWPPRDRPSRVRFAAARHRYPEEMASLLQMVHSRSNWVAINAFSEKLSLGSSLECLFVTSLFADGAEPAFVVPAALPPRTPLPIVCPQTRAHVHCYSFPCLLLRGAALFPQVSFEQGRVYTVDLLQHLHGAWSVIEVDGRGHDGEEDDARTAALGLPVTRMTEAEVLERARAVIRSK